MLVLLFTLPSPQANQRSPASRKLVRISHKTKRNCCWRLHLSISRSLACNAATRTCQVINQTRPKFYSHIQLRHAPDIEYLEIHRQRIDTQWILVTSYDTNASDICPRPRCTSPFGSNDCRRTLNFRTSFCEAELPSQSCCLSRAW
jgi:hypothetical protein